MATPSANIGPLARRPAVSVAVLLVAGILLHAVLPGWIAVGGAILATVLAHLARARPIVASLSLAVAIVGGGAGSARWEHDRYAGNDVGLFATDDARLATVRGRIADAPQVVAGAANGRPLPPRQLFVLDVDGVLTVHGWADASGHLPVRIAQPNPSLAAGQTVRLTGHTVSI